MSTAKNYAKSVLDGYNDTLKRLAARYISVASAIDKKYDARNDEINREARKQKTEADAMNKISLNNTKAGILERGLSSSGESVQAELDHNLARSTAFSKIDETASKQISENERAREEAKNSAINRYVDDINSVEEAKNKAYISQLNADREYEADRDDEAYDRMADERDYLADRDDEKYAREADERDYQLALVESSKKESSSSGTGSGGDGDDDGDGDNRITPKMSPQVFVEKVQMTHEMKGYPTDEKKKAAIRKALHAVITDPTLTYSYRHQVKIYAKAIGLY